MKIKSFLMAALLFNLMLVGCRSVPMASLAQDGQAKQFAINPKAAQVYIYRNEFMGNQLKIDVFVNGEMRGQTMGDTYMLMTLPKGKHTIMSEAENKSTLDIEVENGKNYFVWQEVKMGMWIARNKLQIVDEATGKSGMRECKLIQDLKTGNSLAAAANSEGLKP
ncbi:DUF2846 domain-containing protein [Bdellovibrio sp. HCB185ZH]|uniref:DUF2846 domain-containing protein n=1 Tax=Bdellovibrio sp. HCB185ZH TaxID=3394235 RepID=UPI0039A44A6B